MSQDIDAKALEAVAEAIYAELPNFIMGWEPNTADGYSEVRRDEEFGLDLQRANECRRQARAAILAYKSAEPKAEVAWQPVEQRFFDVMGRYETPEQLAEGLRMSANYWRDKPPSDYAGQPRIMADFHERAAIAIERLLADLGRQG